MSRGAPLTCGCASSASADRLPDLRRIDAELAQDRAGDAVGWSSSAARTCSGVSSWWARLAASSCAACRPPGP
jgi:hypothetical protein